MASRPSQADLDLLERRGAPGRPFDVLRFVVLELLLVLAAYVLAVDLESSLRSWPSIALEVWLVGNVGAAVGFVLLRLVALPAVVVRR